MITPLLRYTPDPHSRSFDSNVRCTYHFDVQGHSIEDCHALKREIKKKIQDKSIMVQNIDSEESSSQYKPVAKMSGDALPSLGYLILLLRDAFLSQSLDSSLQHARVCPKHRANKWKTKQQAQPCPVFKSLSNKVGSLLCFCNAPKKYRRLDSKLETKMMELKRSSSGQSKFRSINSIILKFPRFKEGLKEIKGVFEQFDEDSNGTIDRDELKKCVKKLQFHVKEEEIDDLFDSCDVDEKEAIQFNDFIVLLCLLYLVMDSSSSSDNTSKIGSPELEATFNTIVEAFLFLDKGGDGKLHKKDVIKKKWTGTGVAMSASGNFFSRFLIGLG
ncbi:putative calcium-binding protein CML22 [Capsicum chinense]|nr:putative calcium-binding protein CML22 [Capsicum chinense]